MDMSLPCCCEHRGKLDSWVRLDTMAVRTGGLHVTGLWWYSLGQELGSALHEPCQHNDAIHVNELSGKSHVS